MRLTVLKPDVQQPEEAQQLYAAVKTEWLDEQDFYRQIQSSSILTMAARFNDRYLAVALIDCRQREWCVKWFSVRPVTRRRGVGKLLLEKIIEQAGKAMIRVTPMQPADESLGLFLQTFGFQQQQDDWLYNPNEL